MRHILRATALLSLSSFIGCGTGTVTPPVPVPDISGNWQIQSATGAPNPGVLLQGSLSDNAGTIAGTMRFTNLVVPNSCGVPQYPLAFTGNLTSALVLTLTSSRLPSGSVVAVTLSVDPYPHNLAFGSIEVSGGSCVYAAAEGVGANITSISNTYVGTLVAAASLQSSPTGNGVATLALAQATAPNPDGQYNVTGSLKFVSGTCSDTQMVSGTVSGASANLVSAPVSGVSEVVLSTGVNNYGTQLPGANLVFNAGPCRTGLPAYDTYNGPLNKQ